MEVQIITTTGSSHKNQSTSTIAKGTLTDKNGTKYYHLVKSYKRKTIQCERTPRSAKIVEAKKNSGAQRLEQLKLNLAHL